MTVFALIGGQWGDEGKGKVIDYLAEKADMVVRFSGGDNAGHTVINNYGTFKLHLVPSGIFNSSATCIISNGMVVNPQALLTELSELNTHGVDTSRLFISDRAHIIMPYHILLDGLEEERRGQGALGTTRKGIGPAFTDKTARIGIRAEDLLNKDTLIQRLKPVLELKNLILTKIYQHPPLELEEVIRQYSLYGEQLGPLIRNTGPMIHRAVEEGEFILLEGAQGSLLDTDFGTYPYVTSSSPLAGGGSLGSGIGPMKFNRVVGVFKSYITRVGSGPMPTELINKTGELIREKAHEFGTTTGRPRRCGWFDAVAGRHSVQINSISDIALTHLDIYDGFQSLKICTGYKVDNEVLDYFPSSIAVLEKCQPVYEEMDGWEELTSEAKTFDQLPPAAQRYIGRIEELLHCYVSFVTVGPHRDQTIMVRPILA
jgi:adenylosuccinate synthase